MSIYPRAWALRARQSRKEIIQAQCKRMISIYPCLYWVLFMIYHVEKQKWSSSLAGVGHWEQEEEGLIQAQCGRWRRQTPRRPSLSFLNLSPCGRPGLTTHNNSSTQWWAHLWKVEWKLNRYTDCLHQTVSVHQQLCQTLSPCFAKG